MEKAAEAHQGISHRKIGVQSGHQIESHIAADGQEEIDGDAADVTNERRPGARRNGWEDHPADGPEHELVEFAADPSGESAMAEIVEQ